MSEFLVSNEGGMLRSLLRHRGARGKLEHVRHFREDLNPHMERVKAISELQVGNKSEYQYLGSIPRIVIDDWLRKLGKNWNDYATDKDLKAKFMVWFKNDYKKLLA